ncbi:WSC domain-containing protein [Lineolata rhizophorae]|uniref:WSC domain-containing protein n=1 Tax=Lineolata rhizophorae TaxID=578093 RepID=A0A6A6NV34_9PEZI|nr:WSC domain-containing protein [Lineolata rhizophorae]
MRSSTVLALLVLAPLALGETCSTSTISFSPLPSPIYTEGRKVIPIAITPEPIAESTSSSTCSHDISSSSSSPVSTSEARAAAKGIRASSTSCPPTSKPAESSVTADAAVYKGNSNWAYLGCYSETMENPDSGDTRALNGEDNEEEHEDDLQPEDCFNKCDGYVYAGLEYATECWCSNRLSSLAKQLPEEECDMSCGGNDSLVCGSSNRITLYKLENKEEEEEEESTASLLLAGGLVSDLNGNTGLAVALATVLFFLFVFVA